MLVYESVSSGLFVELRILLMYPVALASPRECVIEKCRRTLSFEGVRIVG